MGFNRFFRDKKILIIVLILLALGLRFVTYKYEFSGYDPFVHYSVVEQALENRNLPVRNNLDGCPGGVNISHPLGFYMFPFMLGYFIDLKIAFAIVSVLCGILTIYMVFLLFEKAFNFNTAMIGSFFLAICMAHIFRSHANYYRGENIMLPFFLFSIICALKFLTEENKFFFQFWLRYSQPLQSFFGQAILLLS